VRDLLFASRIRETARRLGYPVRSAATVPELEAGLAERPRLVMLDLAGRDLDLEGALAAIEAAGRPAPVLAWTTHALWKASRPLHDRCTRVITREQLTAELPDLLRAYLEPTAGGTGQASER
jgi:hypothetical protein